MTQLAIGIPTCVFPAGCQHLLQNILDYTPAGTYEVFVVLDGNEGWARLDKMERYRKRFGFFDRGSWLRAIWNAGKMETR